MENINNLMNRNRRQESGQVALILVFLTAVALILLAVVLNLDKVSQTKTLTTLASNSAASTMASTFASYSEQLYQVQLGGSSRAGDDLTTCGWTGVFAVFLTIITIVASFWIPGLE